MFIFISREIDWAVVATDKLLNFAFLPLCSQEIFVNPLPINTTYFFIISTKNLHFEQNIMDQTTNNHSAKFGGGNVHYGNIKFGDGNVNCGNVDNSRHTNIYNSDEDAKMMNWLSPLEPDTRHQGLRNDRFEGVGNWLLETSEFREWRGSDGGADKAILFCSGDPGVGKSYLR